MWKDAMRETTANKTPLTGVESQRELAHEPFNLAPTRTLFSVTYAAGSILKEWVPGCQGRRYEVTQQVEGKS